MKWLNRYNIPDEIIRLLPKVYRPVKNRFSITSLIDAPRVRTLQLERWDDIIRDYSDLITTLHGIAMHERNERFANDDEEAEHKYENEINGITVVGKADVFDGKILRDTKNLAVGSLEFGSRIKDMIAQTNCYVWQRRKRGGDVEKILIDVFYRDWKLRDYERASYKLYKIYQTVKAGDIVRGYPPCGYTRVELPLWSFEEQNQYIKDQLEYHAMSPMDCDNEARWKSKDKYAIMKKGRKSAIAATYVLNGERMPFYSKEVAESFASKEGYTGNMYNIEKRIGVCARCKNYCSVRSVCEFAKKGE